MTNENDIARLLVEAQQSGSRDVDQSLLSGIDRAAVYRVQRETMTALGATAGMYKVGIDSDGVGVIAPIYTSRIGQSGNLKLPAASVAGLEVEIGIKLALDLPPGSDETAVLASIQRYFVGVEICGTRFIDRGAASYEAGLADNMSALGYALGTSDWEGGTSIEDREVVLSLGGTEIYRAVSKHSFGGVLPALLAYARLTEQPYPLTAGTLVTTGSMCGLVPTSASGTAVAEFGGHRVTVDLV